MAYEAVIGLEVHIQLNTRSKLFCACPNEFAGEANTRVCPVCLGLPGSLPVLIGVAVESVARLGLALGATVQPRSIFARKNYFYPDMPKNYQISQYDLPICLGGAVPLNDLAYPKDAQKHLQHPGQQVHLVRIHLEEDVAKSFHFETTSGIDFNRAGTPLMEIVTEPQMSSPEGDLEYSSDMAEISGFGGGYEECCRRMVLRGVAWLRRFEKEQGVAPQLSAGAIEGVYGLIKPTNADTTLLLDEMAKPELGATGAMVHATLTHVTYISQRGGSDEYVKLKKEQFEQEKNFPE